MSDLKIDTGGGNVLDCIQVVEDVVMKCGDEIDALCWQRIRARLNPDREAVARAIDMATLQKLPVHQLIAATEAAIAAMKGETP